MSYGILGVGINDAYVNVSVSAETAKFAVNNIRT